MIDMYRAARIDDVAVDEDGIGRFPAPSAVVGVPARSGAPTHRRDVWFSTAPEQSTF